MFNFLKFRRARKNKRFSADIHELNEQEMEMLLGGSPVRTLLTVGNKSPFEQYMTNTRFTDVGFNDARYQPLPSTPYQDMTWRQRPSWLQVAEENGAGWSKGYE